MDILKVKTRITEAMGKYKYVWIVLLAGMVLMMIPGKDNRAAEAKQDTVQAGEKSLQQSLEEILSHVKGAGRVKVMLAIAQGERILYQTDSTYSQSDNNTDSRTQTILITDSGRNETGLIHQKNPPVYQGAIILAQGADIPAVRLAIVEAVSDVTGLGADKISVLKMQ